MGEPFHHSTTPSLHCCNGLPANCNHLAARLVTLPKVVLLRLSIDHMEKELPQLRIARAGAERRQNVKLECAAKTGPKFAVAGQAKFVAALAKMQIRHRADEPNPLVPSW